MVATLRWCDRHKKRLRHATLRFSILRLVSWPVVALSECLELLARHLTPLVSAACRDASRVHHTRDVVACSLQPSQQQIVVMYPHQGIPFQGEDEQRPAWTSLTLTLTTNDVCDVPLARGVGLARVECEVGPTCGVRLTRGVALARDVRLSRPIGVRHRLPRAIGQEEEHPVEPQLIPSAGGLLAGTVGRREQLLQLLVVAARSLTGLQLAQQLVAEVSLIVERPLGSVDVLERGEIKAALLEGEKPLQHGPVTLLPRVDDGRLRRRQGGRRVPGEVPGEGLVNRQSHVQVDHLRVEWNVPRVVKRLTRLALRLDGCRGRAFSCAERADVAGKGEPVGRHGTVEHIVPLKQEVQGDSRSEGRRVHDLPRPLLVDVVLLGTGAKAFHEVMQAAQTLLYHRVAVQLVKQGPSQRQRNVGKRLLLLTAGILPHDDIWLRLVE
mmetsp:Transcript_42851/g.121435  ORF Transcript_42851/g.121435 Transcript_42851/m.121435 type:complete len:439 (+) Transcript_42851:545-1861(+)